MHTLSRYISKRSFFYLMKLIFNDMRARYHSVCNKWPFLCWRQSASDCFLIVEISELQVDSRPPSYADTCRQLQWQTPWLLPKWYRSTWASSCWRRLAAIQARDQLCSAAHLPLSNLLDKNWQKPKMSFLKSNFFLWFLFKKVRRFWWQFTTAIISS